ncbi:MAG: response regulator [Pseudomonadota bacterium]
MPQQRHSAKHDEVKISGGSVQLPLSGVMILLVEDSRFYSEAIRLLSLRSGARLRRADSVRAAQRHLSIHRPDAMIVDMGLPDGLGEDVIALASRLETRPVILATSGESAGIAERALAAGADDFMIKPLQDLAVFQQTLSRLLRRQGKPVAQGLQVVGTRVIADHKAMDEDLNKAISLIVTDPDYAAQFSFSVAEAAGDRELAAIAQTAIELGDFDVLHKVLIERTKRSDSVVL